MLNLVPFVTVPLPKILAKLGAGSRGEVYRAQDTNLNRQAAVKVLPDIVIVPVQSAPVPLTLIQNWTALAKQ